MYLSQYQPLASCSTGSGGCRCASCTSSRTCCRSRFLSRSSRLSSSRRSSRFLRSWKEFQFDLI